MGLHETVFLRHAKILYEQIIMQLKHTEMWRCYGSLINEYWSRYSKGFQVLSSIFVTLDLKF